MGESLAKKLASDPTEDLVESKVAIDNIKSIALLFGNRDKNIKYIETKFQVSIITRGGEIVIIGKKRDVESVQRLFSQMLEMLQKGDSLTLNEVKYFVTLAKNGEGDMIKEPMRGSVLYSSRKTY